jgi:hypothetical protein
VRNGAPLPTSVMPKGVEHFRPPSQMPAPSCLPTSVMPKGVEHSTGIAYRLFFESAPDCRGGRGVRYPWRTPVGLRLASPRVPARDRRLLLTQAVGDRPDPHPLPRGMVSKRLAASWQRPSLPFRIADFGLRNPKIQFPICNPKSAIRNGNQPLAPARRVSSGEGRSGSGSCSIVKQEGTIPPTRKRGGFPRLDSMKTVTCSPLDSINYMAMHHAVTTDSGS